MRPILNEPARTEPTGGGGGNNSQDWLFGWDSLPGIVSVWADRTGQAVVWQRITKSSAPDATERDTTNDWPPNDDSGMGNLAGTTNPTPLATVTTSLPQRVRSYQERFRPWLIAAHLDDLHHLGSALIEASRPGADRAAFTYRELKTTTSATHSNPSQTLRYFISAQDGRALNRAILTGAAIRLGQNQRGSRNQTQPQPHHESHSEGQQTSSHSFRTMRDLPQDEYYWVGPVEQYLILTGRVYYRGMVYSDLHRLQFDLETTGLSPKESRIFLVAVKDTHGLETILEAPRPDQEARLILDLCALIRQRDPDVIENHNLFGFDLPFLEHRARVLGIPLLLGRAEAPAQARSLEHYEEPAGWGHRPQTRYTVAGRELIDTLDAVRRHDFVARTMSEGHGLKAAARHFGLASPHRTYLTGSQIYATYGKDPEVVRRYAFDDVREVEVLSRHLMGAAFALAGMAPRSYQRVASAGPATGLLEPMLVRAYVRAGHSLPRNAALGDAELAPHQGGSTVLYAGGLARQVVKADIASMYPSIMRTFGIGSASDPLGVLLYLVDQLTSLRLRHKGAAREAAPNTYEWQTHNALHSAMKLIINSAYGYLAAGKMALFADRRAADEVTRRGRELLAGVAGELEGHGMVLLEADTDGVFFAVPAGWTEQQERDCVREVGDRILPPGIKLEYEGRYHSMLSHEVKNYALMTYGGQLIVKGNAFHSSRSEGFGEEFLKAALGLTLVGDTEELYRLYRQTVAAIRARRYSPDEMATVARLTKSYEHYQHTRKRSREAPYEALLAAGRTEWQVGERVKFYRAEGGQPIWLPTTTISSSGRGDVSGDEDKAGGVESRVTSGPGLPVTDHQQPLPPPHSRLDPVSLPLPPYDVANYLEVLQTSYVSRLHKAFLSEDFEQLFRLSGQTGLFDKPLNEVQPAWIET